MIELFAVHDAAAERYIEPFPADTAEVAIRGFKKACLTDRSQFQQFPEDFSLWHVGSFDPQFGTIEGLTPRKIAMATSFVPRDVGNPAAIRAIKEQA